MPSLLSPGHCLKVLHLQSKQQLPNARVRWGRTEAETFLKEPKEAFSFVLFFLISVLMTMRRQVAHSWNGSESVHIYETVTVVLSGHENENVLGEHTYQYR